MSIHPLKASHGVWWVCLLMVLVFLAPIGAAPAPEKNQEPSRSHSAQNQEESKKSSFHGERGNFIFDQADLKNVLLFFAKIYHFNIVIAPGIQGKVTCHLLDVPWDQALDLILKQHGLAAITEGDNITITPPISQHTASQK